MIASGETTTPLPMKHFTPGCMMPEGIRRTIVFLPPITSVCPALCPPWKRTTAATVVGEPVDDLALALVAPLRADHHDVLCHLSCLSAARPSSGLPSIPGCGRSPARRARPRAREGPRSRSRPPREAAPPPRRARDPRRRARGCARRARRGAGERGEAAQVHGEPGGGPRAPEGAPHLVVAAAPRQRVGRGRREGREHHAAFVVEAAQLGQVEAHLDAGRGRLAREARELVERLRDDRVPRQRLARLVRARRASPFRRVSRAIASARSRPARRASPSTAGASFCCTAWKSASASSAPRSAPSVSAR